MFFCYTGLELVFKFGERELPALQSITVDNDMTFKFKHPNETDVLKVLASASSKKAHGLDEIAAKLVRMRSDSTDYLPCKKRNHLK